MIRRRREKRVRTPNIFKPKYTTKRQQRKAQYKRDRPIVRRQAYDRDGGRCRCPCKRPLVFEPADASSPFQIYHANEMVSRGKGGSALFLENIIGFAPECHEMFTRGKLKLGWGSLGANGIVIMIGQLADGSTVDGYQSAPWGE